MNAIEELATTITDIEEEYCAYEIIDCGLTEHDVWNETVDLLNTDPGVLARHLAEIYVESDDERIARALLEMLRMFDLDTDALRMETGMDMHIVHEHEVEAAIFTKLDFTEDDERYRSYMVHGWLDAFCVRDYKTGNWYCDAARVKGEEYAI